MEIKIKDLAKPEFKADPYPFYARLRRESPVVRSTLLRQPTWLVSRYDDVVRILKDERFVKDWPPRTKWIHRLSGPITRNMLNQDGADHTRLRSLVHKAFSPSLVERLRQRIQDACDELLDPLARDGRMDLMSGYALPLPLTIIAELLGIPKTDRSRFYSLARSSLSVSTIPGVLRALPDQRLIIRRLHNLIADRRKNPQDDLITALVQVREAGDKLSEPELIGMINLLLIAGYETTVNLIGSGALALIQNPDQLKLLMESPEGADIAIEELLRFTSPLDTATQRFAGDNLALDSVTIPRGDVVIALLGSANHDETQFREPETLDLRRDPNRHVAFGQGAHFCIGAPLARLEGQIALLTLFRRFPHVHLAQPARTLLWRKSLIIRGLEHLPVAR